MNKHTPGPWSYRLNRHTGPTITADSSDTDIVHLLSITDSGEQELANARLIAAAPDLLAALERIVKLGRAKARAGLLTPCERTMREIGAAAITRAKGEA